MKGITQMTEEFNKWWNEDLLTEDNHYVEGTAAYWAWEGWCAAVKVEREACAKVCDEYSATGKIEEFDRGWLACAKNTAAAIRARGNT
jgi:hypothetical protein